LTTDIWKQTPSFCQMVSFQVSLKPSKFSPH
jgi:hypothetical protein